jgi:hypothetical protein
VAAGALAYVFGREQIEDTLAGIGTTKPKRKEKTQTAKAKPKQTETAIMVILGGSGDKFHRATCRYAPADGEEISREKAVSEGLAPCGVCKP